jgi:ferric iron reductase protein FhuF
MRRDDSPTVTLDEVLAAVAGCVSYLRASTGTDGEHWIACDELLDADRLRLVVDAARPGFETEDPMVAASLFTQAYAFRVAGVVLAAYALDLPVPNAAPRATAVRIDGPRPRAVAYLQPTVRTRSPDDLAADLLAGHLAPFVDTMHSAYSVGARLLWGNVFASMATALRAVEGAVEDRQTIRHRAERFIAAAAPWSEGLGTFTVVTAGGSEGWYWDRTSCCLWYRAGSKEQMCDNCSLIDATALVERRQRELTETSA